MPKWKFGGAGGTPTPGPGDSPRVAGNNEVAMIGDSRMAFAAVPVGSFNCRYPVTAARQRMRGKLHTDWNDMFQTGGFTLASIQSTHYPSAVASTAKTCLLLGGVNDNGSNPTASAAIIQAMADDWTARGPDYVFVVCNEVPPAAGWAGNMTGHRALHDLIDAMEDRPNGIYVADTWLAATGDNSNTPLVGLYMTGDTVHFSTLGAFATGPALQEPLDVCLPAFDLLGGTTPDFSQAIALGTLAASDFANNRTGSVGTYTVDITTFEGNPWIRMVAAGADGNGGVYRSSATVPGGFVAGTTKVQSVCEYVLLDGHSNVRNLNLAPYKQSGSPLNANVPSGAAGFDGSHSGSGSDAAIGSMPPGEHRGFLWTPICLYDAAATQFRPWWAQLQARAAGGMNATLYLRNFQCRVIP